MTGRRRGRTGRGWDAAPPREPRDDAPEWTSPWRTGRSQRTGPGRSGSRDGAGPAEPGDQGSADQGTVDPGERAREICLRLLAVRPRTRSELASALRQRGVAAEVAAEVLERYSEVGIIDDRAFANAWVTSRHHGKGLARRALAIELRRKGVDDSVVGEALDDLDPGTEAATARALVDRKLRTDRGGPPDAVFRRMVGMLARKGYAPGLAVRVVKEALAEAGDQGEGLEEVVDVDLLEAEARAAESDPTD